MSQILSSLIALLLFFYAAIDCAAKGGVMVVGQPSAAKYFADEIAQSADLPTELSPNIPSPPGFSGFSAVVFVELDSKSRGDDQWQWNLGANAAAVAAYVEAGGQIFLVGGRLPFSGKDSDNTSSDKQPLIQELLGVGKIGRVSSQLEVRAQATNDSVGIFDDPVWKEGVVLASANTILTAATLLESAEPLLEATSEEGTPLILATRHRIGKGAIHWLSVSPFRVARSSHEEVQKSSPAYNAAIVRLIQESLSSRR